MIAFALGFGGWAFILFEIFVESAKECPKDEHVQTCVTLMELMCLWAGPSSLWATTSAHCPT